MEGSGTSWDWIFDPDHVARITAKLRDGHGKEEWPEPGNQSAAVLVPIMAVDGVPSVLFTLRSRDLSRHRNQVSFPGGLAETTDATPMMTALRETEEELGIDRSKVEVWGKMNVYGYHSRNISSSITPVVGLVRDVDISQLQINRSEVAQVFTLPLAHIACKNNQQFTEFRTGSTSRRYRLPVFLGGPRRIWGFTGLALDMLIAHIMPKECGYIPIMARTFSKLKA